MAGELVPIVLLPRYTTVASLVNDYFKTVALDVTQYDQLTLDLWRGKIVGGATTGFTLYLQESMDRTFWRDCTTTPSQSSGLDPGEDSQLQVVATLKARWLRARLYLGATDNVVTCWATGFLQARSS